MKTERIWLLAALLWWGLSLWLLLKPPSGNAPPFAHYDKLGHFVLFAVQAALLAPAWPRRRLLALLWPLALWAGLSECLQGGLTAARQADLFDALADMAGAACALGLWWAVRRRSGKLLSFAGR